MEMLESGPNGSRDASDCYLEDNWVNPGMKGNQLMYNLVQVENKGTFVPASEGEIIEADYILRDSQTEKALDDDSMYLNSESEEKCLAMDDFPCATDYYNQEVNYGILDTDAAHIGKHESKYEFVDSMLQGVDDERNFHLTCNLSSLCDDYLLDSGYTESSMLDDTSHIELKKSGSECQTQHRERVGNVGEISDSSNAINPLAESTSDQSTSFLDDMNVQELHDTFRSTFGRDTCVKDKRWLKRRILFGLQNLGEIDNVSGLVESGLPSNENEDNMILIPGNNLCERVCSFLTDVPDRRTLIAGRGVGKDGHSGEDSQMVTSSEVSRVGLGLLNSGETENSILSSKRLRKPTRRYIEEASERKSRCCNERLKTSVISSRDKLLCVRTGRQCVWKGVMPLVYQECPAVTSIQVPCGLHVRRGRPRKNASLMGNDKKEHILHSVSPKTTLASEHSESESLDDISDDLATETGNAKSGIRRKHHRQWTLSEVVKLVDGVSRYGVGKWTEIKRVLFSTSAYRTSVDLKDKWRNLLRASVAQQHNRNQFEPQKKHASLSIPQSVLRRVRELSIIHPYPRERKSRLPLPAATPAAASGNDTSISRCGRTVQKRSFT